MKSRLPVFAQCWSLVAESDALWRIYSRIDRDPQTNADLKSPLEGVRVRTTVGKLLSMLWVQSPTDPADCCFLGKVDYYDQERAVNIVANVVQQKRQSAYAGGRGHAEVLMIKRQPFAHEAEVRLIMVDHYRQVAGRMHFVDIDPDRLFDEITLDPRLLPGAVEDRIARLREAGYTGDITTSSLYQRTLYQLAVKNLRLDEAPEAPISS
jgi:hypothetical protein